MNKNYTTELYAQPFDLDAVGFFFSNYDEYETKVSKLTNSCGQPVEEFEIQYIDGVFLRCLTPVRLTNALYSYGSMT